MFNKTLVLLIFLFTTALPTLSFSHAKIVKTFPKNNAVLQISPKKITLTFPEPVQVTTFKLENDKGEKLDVEGGKSISPTKQINAKPPTLQQGTYYVNWRGLSSDGHPTKGHFNFTITP
ncbi:copper resistance CopC family protein [Kiloniella antarctica]|uniref:Copper resistance protein CopC n=1 Tax=Kiloniella antarctica TaxID=1550907 RepID=A0ABW5BGR2_9PROT